MNNNLTFEDELQDVYWGEALKHLQSPGMAEFNNSLQDELDRFKRKLNHYHYEFRIIE